jgi:hypothetical protein
MQKKVITAQLEQLMQDITQGSAYINELLNAPDPEPQLSAIMKLFATQKVRLEPTNLGFSFSPPLARFIVALGNTNITITTSLLSRMYQSKENKYFLAYMLFSIYKEAADPLAVAHFLKRIHDCSSVGLALFIQLYELLDTYPCSAFSPGLEKYFYDWEWRFKQNTFDAFCNIVLQDIEKE